MRPFFRFIRPSVFLCGAVLFLLAVAVAWVLFTNFAFEHAQARLVENARDMRGSVRTVINDLLLFNGMAIVRRYRTPEDLSKERLGEILSRYSLDELNVVDGRGRVVAGTLAKVGYDMAERPETAAFNCLLRGRQTYVQPFRSALSASVVRKYAGVAFPSAPGYIEVGFDYARLRREIDYRFASLAQNWHIGENGYFVCADEEDGVILSSGHRRSDAHRTLADIGFDRASAPADADEVFVATLYGEKCLCLTDVRYFHRILVVIPCADVLRERNGTVGATALILLALSAVGMVFVTKLLDMVRQLRQFIAQDRGRREKDLALARTIQLSALPVLPPRAPDFAVAARVDTAREVGGDFYDFHILSSNRLLVVVADVSGKGISAALFMMRAKTVLHACVLQSGNLEEAVGEANQRLCENNDAEMFVTAWVGLYDRDSGHLAFVNAGHNPPLVRRADGSVEWLRARRKSMALAVSDGVSYRVQEADLAHGDALVLYTDGVTEALNRSGELFGERRLEDALLRTPSDWVAVLRAEVAAFAQGTEQSDDITLLSLERT